MLNRKSFEKEPPLWIITAQGLLYAQHLLLFTLKIYSAFQMQNFLECVPSFHLNDYIYRKKLVVSTRAVEIR